MDQRKFQGIYVACELARAEVVRRVLPCVYEVEPLAGRSGSVITDWRLLVKDRREQARTPRLKQIRRQVILVRVGVFVGGVGLDRNLVQSYCDLLEAMAIDGFVAQLRFDD